MKADTPSVCCLLCGGGVVRNLAYGMVMMRHNSGKRILSFVIIYTHRYFEIENINAHLYIFKSILDKKIKLTSPFCLMHLQFLN